MPGWAIAVIAIVASFLVLAVLAAVAIPTFLNERARAAAPQIPDRIGALTRSSDEAVTRDVARIAANLGSGQRDKQGAAFVDASGSRHVFVITAGFVTPVNDAFVVEFERGYWDGMRGQVPLGMELSSAVPRHAGRLGGRVTCAPLISPDGVTAGEVCLAVDANAWVSTIDLSLAGQLDPTLIDTVREAVLPGR